MNIEQYMQDIGQRARIAARELSRAGTDAKNAALLAMADAIEQAIDTLLTANNKDLQAGKESGLDSAMLDRLELNETRIKSMAEGLRQIAALTDPVGAVSDLKTQTSGIQVGRMRVPRLWTNFWRVNRLLKRKQKPSVAQLSGKIAKF